MQNKKVKTQTISLLHPCGGHSRKGKIMFEQYFCTGCECWQEEGHECHCTPDGKFLTYVKGIVANLAWHKNWLAFVGYEVARLLTGRAYK